MDTRHLEYFVDLARTGSLSKTAQKFYTSHQVIKKGIDHLEREFGATLIEPNSRGVSYTEAGRVAYEHAADILRQHGLLKEALQPYRDDDQGSQTTINLSLTPYLANDLVLKAVDSYKRSHKDVDVIVRSKPFLDGIEDLKTADDVFLMPYGSQGYESLVENLAERNMKCTSIARSDIYVVASTKTDWAHYRKFDSENIKSVPVLSSLNRYAPHYSFFGHDAFEPSQIISGIDALKRLVDLGSGVGLVTKKEFNYYFSEKKNYALIPTDFGFVGYCAVTIDSGLRNEEAKELLSAIGAQL